MDDLVLTKRLQSVADMVTLGNRVCDVGCDHGYVSIYLVKNEISPFAIAMDVRPGPLSQAEKNIKAFRAESKATTRLSDGLDKLKFGEADTIVIAGMGGPLMRDIIVRGLDVAKSVTELVLQPQSEIPEFRRFLKTNGFTTTAEDMVYEDGKFYPMMKVVPDPDFEFFDFSRLDEPFSVDELYGPRLVASRNKVLMMYLNAEYKELMEIREQLLRNVDGSEKSRERLKEIEERIEINRSIE
ncbi:tRNA (adenine22-N1)-methyltransferase [Lachnospiraceae bacterium G11]|nr:tRNA (adenine22-N1)-methyltransferase [Lachnospiraceae bacterium G11]